MKGAVSTLAAVAGALLLSCGAVSGRPIALADYLEWETAGAPAISPDGERVIYLWSRVDPVKDGWVRELWVMNADGSGKRRFDSGWNVAWSPEGNRVAYLSSSENGVRILIRDATDSGFSEPRSATEEEISPSSITWSPDGTKLAFASMVPFTETWPVEIPEAPEGARWTDPPAIVDTLHFRNSAGAIANSRRHLFVLDLETSSVEQITSGNWFAGARYSGFFFGSAFAWSADSRALFFDGDTEFDDTLENMDRSHIYRVDIESKRIDRLTEEPGFWRTPSASPDGRHLVHTGFAKSPDSFAPRELRLIDLGSGESRTLVANLPDEVYRFAWAGDASGVYVTQDRAGSTNIEFVHLGGMQQAVTSGRQRLYLGGISANGTGIASHTTPTSGYDVVSIDMQNGEISMLTSVNAQRLSEIRLGDVEEFWYEARDGQPVQGWLYHPPDFDPGNRYPLILEIHGGPHYMAGNDFSFRLHEFAARGYLVLLTNPRGSTGYGAAFANAIDDAFPGDVDSGDLLSGIDSVVARDIVDEDRIYAMGCSGGGSLAAWLSSHSDRFAAVSVSCAVTNRISMAGTTDAVGWSYSSFPTPFWEDPTAWLKHSPIMHVGRVETPTLVMVGENDGRTPVAQSAEYYLALKVKGVPTKLLIFRDEGHGPWRSKPSNLFRTQQYLHEWFSTYTRSMRDR
ncbi:MAG: S9 family peptidase [Gammaproteobacteria bacterium]|nr:S9 family peptidase [Gammaproteobacteria bacterium]